MKKVIWVLAFTLSIHAATAQYYLRGEITDNRGHLLTGVKITLFSKGTVPYYSGNGGTFGISTTVKSDTITLFLDGYEVLKKEIDTRKFQYFQLKMLPTTASMYNRKLASKTTNLKSGLYNSTQVQGESYSSQVENSFIDADKYPETGFAMNIDKASYSNIRRFLNNGMRVPVDAVRIEEMLNYFDFTSITNNIHAPGFICKPRITNCPWEPENQLLFLNIAAPKLQLDSIPPSNLVFLIDISGSMDKANRLALLQSGFKMLADNLRARDTISIVTYGGGVGIALAPTSGNEKEKIKNAIDSLVASGDTPGEDAIRIAYNLAKKRYIPGGNNRVILATDGDFNVGQSTEKELEDLIINYKQTGIYLTCLGVGMGNYKDSKLEALAKKGNGNFAYIDNLQEAQKVLVTEFTQTLYAVANNTFLKIDFEPGMIKAYRLIGFDNKENAIADSTSELEGGDIGSGHSMMAIFEITPVKKEPVGKQRKLAAVSLQYKKPGDVAATQVLFDVPCQPVDITLADSAYRFAASIAMFGSILKRSAFVKNYLFEDVWDLAKTAVNPNNPQQAEFLSLVEKAGDIYEPNRKKRKNK